MSLYFAKSTMINVGESIKKNLQYDMVNTLIGTDTEIIDKKHSGKFISNLTYDVNHITNLLSNALLTLFKDSLTLIGLLLVMFLQNWKLALISIIMIPLASVSAKTLGKRINKVTTEASVVTLFILLPSVFAETLAKGIIIIDIRASFQFCRNITNNKPIKVKLSLNKVSSALLSKLVI